MKNIIVILVSAGAFLSGCAIGPLVGHETGRTVGRGHHELAGGVGETGFMAKWNYGITEDLDLGLHWESLSLGVRGKYAFINNRQSGWSLAGALGVGSSFGGDHVYADLIASRLAGRWEPYGTIRVVRVKSDPVKFQEKDTGKEIFIVQVEEFEYAQGMLGTRYWFTDHWSLSVEAGSLASMTSGFRVGDNAFASAGLGYRF